jgi:hypothetical protein
MLEVILTGRLKKELSPFLRFTKEDKEMAYTTQLVGTKLKRIITTK